MSSEVSTTTSEGVAKKPQKKSLKQKARGGPRTKAISASARANIVFPSARCKKKLKAVSGVDRVGPTAGVFLAATLEYLAAELLQVAGEVANPNPNKEKADPNKKGHRITPEHIMQATLEDDELGKLFSNVKIVNTSARPLTQAELFKTMSKKSKIAALKKHKKQGKGEESQPEKPTGDAAKPRKATPEEEENSEPFTEKKKTTKTGPKTKKTSAPAEKPKKASTPSKTSSKRKEQTKSKTEGTKKSKKQKT